MSYALHLKRCCWASLDAAANAGTLTGRTHECDICFADLIRPVTEWRYTALNPDGQRALRLEMQQAAPTRVKDLPWLKEDR